MTPYEAALLPPIITALLGYAAFLVRLAMSE